MAVLNFSQYQSPEALDQIRKMVTQPPTNTDYKPETFKTEYTGPKGSLQRGIDSAKAGVGAAMLGHKYGDDFNKLSSAPSQEQPTTAPDAQTAPTQQASTPSAPPGNTSDYDTSYTNGLMKFLTTDPHSQQGGAQAVQDQQKQLQQSSQSLADTQAAGGNVVPDATQSGSGALAQRNQNNQTGTATDLTGAVNPETPPALTPEQQKNATLDQTGKDTFKSMNTIGNWYESKSFLMGMMQTGLSLLDGKGYSDSFAAGSKYFDDHYGMEQRQQWGDDLLKQGYDRQQIQQYIETGDSKVLESPQERIAKQQATQIQLQTGQENLNKLQYENSPEVRAAAEEDRRISNQYKQAQSQYMAANAEFKASPEYQQSIIDKNQAQAQASQSRTELNQVNTRIKQQQVSATDSDSNGTPVLLGGNFGDTGLKVVLGAKDRKPAMTSGGRETWVFDPKTKQQFTVPTNQVVSIQTENDAANLGKQLGEFKDENGLKYYGFTGDLRRGIGDTLLQRTSADLKSRVADIDGKTQSLLVDAILMMQPGFAVKDAEIEAKKYSAGQLVDPKTGELAEISGKRAAEIIEERMKAANSMMAMARSRRQGTTTSQTPTTINQTQVTKGQVITRGGKQYIALQDGSTSDPIFQPYNGQ